MSQPVQSYIYYKGRGFPFDKQVFQNKTFYFEKFAPTDIYILGEFENVQPPITHDNIAEMIDFIQNDQIDIKVKNVMQLHKLGVWMKCPELIEITDMFIETHKHELLKEFFNSNYELTHEYEQLISENLMAYIDEEKFMKFPISVIDRIIMKYLQNRSCSRKIIDFVFKYIESGEPDASVLFRLIKVDEDEEYFLEKLYYKNSQKYDLTFLPSSHFIYLLNQKFQ